MRLIFKNELENIFCVFRKRSNIVLFTNVSACLVYKSIDLSYWYVLSYIIFFIDITCKFLRIQIRPFLNTRIRIWPRKYRSEAMLGLIIFERENNVTGLSEVEHLCYNFRGFFLHFLYSFGQQNCIWFYIKKCY